MRKIIFSIMVAFLLFGGTAFSDEDCPVEDSANQAIKEEMEKAADIIGSYATKPDFSALDGCLDSIGSFSLDLGIGIPNLESLLQSACDIANDAISDTINDATSSVTSKYSLGGSSVGISKSSEPSFDYRINDTSDEIVDSIWNSIQ